MNPAAGIFWVGLFAAGGTACWAQDTTSSVSDLSPLSQAREHVEQDQPHRAIAVLEATSAARRSFEANMLLGRNYQQVQRLGDARRAYRAAIGQQPTASQPHLLLGGVYLAEGKWALAGQALESAERWGIDSAELHAGLARVFHHRGHCLGRVQTRALKSASAGQVRGDVYVIEPVPTDEGLYFVAPRASAIFHLQRALDEGSDDVALRLLEADIWLCAGRHRRALIAYRAVTVDALPDQEQPQYHYHFAQACLGADDVEGYLAHLRRAVALAPDAYPDALAQAYRTLAERSAADGDLARYLEFLKLALARAPDDADLHYCLGNAYFEAGQYNDAAHHWLITLELQPDHPDRPGMLDRLGRLSNPRPARGLPQ